MFKTVEMIIAQFPMWETVMARASANIDWAPATLRDKVKETQGLMPGLNETVSNTA